MASDLETMTVTMLEYLLDSRTVCCLEMKKDFSLARVMGLKMVYHLGKTMD